MAEAEPEAKKQAPSARKTKTKRAPRTTPKAAEPSGAEKAHEKKHEKEDTAPKAPRRPTLEPAQEAMLRLRRQGQVRRPRFTRQASYRYYRIGREGSWRRPRGLQSKQRRHYGYRSAIVRVGYRGPRSVRGLSPVGFEPVIVRTPGDVAALDAKFQAALIARTVGTRRRLVLEETARSKGVRVLNPLVRETGET